MPGKVRLFARDDPRIPMSLKSRIGKWADKTPTSQFQQYGPLNKYFNLKFNRSTHMVKPQALFRKPIEDEDERLLLEWGEEWDDTLPAEPELEQRVLALRVARAAGDISTDSTHQGYAWKSNASGDKFYPDFAICEHYDHENDPLPSDVSEAHNEVKDRVRVIVEVASLPRGLSDIAIARLHAKTLQQLEQYLDSLGEHDERSDPGEIMGVALVGAEVGFLLPVDEPLHKWGHVKNKWYSLFGTKFQEMMDEAVAYGLPK
ncbi:hypothetical protein C8T65DRAFT_662527 [Cerioporus squamosus]|nr:hypothetical protein C8T65DRAFT_662527 [Cerioporus squamosus]